MAQRTRASAEDLELILDTTSGAQPREVEKYIGAEIRKRRRQRDMTVLELAQRAGLSQGMLSKIENGQTSPSLSTLAALADALGLPISTLFSPLDQSRDVSFVPEGQGLAIDRRGTRAGHLYSLLGHGIGGPIGVEPYMITLDKGSDAFAEFQHEGVEFIYMLEGEVIYRHGEGRYRLAPGDSLFFDAVAPHGPEELLTLPAKYLSIISYPRAQGGGQGGGQGD